MKVISIMERDAQKWQPQRSLPNPTINNLTYEELTYEQGFLHQVLKHRSRQLQALRRVLRAQEEDFHKLWKHKCDIETRIVGIKRLKPGAREKVKTREDYSLQLERMTPAEIDRELARLYALKETEGR